MQSRSIRRSGQPTCATASRMRAFDRDLIRGGHYGQRSCEPHKQAEHMAAPTSLRREESPCQPGAVHTWHEADMLDASIDVHNADPAVRAAWLEDKFLPPDGFDWA